MLQTGFLTIPITDNYTLDMENVTSVRLIQDETNNQRVLVNEVPLIDRVENILPADGTVCPNISLEIKFVQGLIPTSNPVRLIYVQIRKLITEKKCTNAGEIR